MASRLREREGWRQSEKLLVQGTNSLRHKFGPYPVNVKSKVKGSGQECPLHIEADILQTSDIRDGVSL